MVEEDKDRKIKTLLADISLLESYIQDLFAFTPLPLCFTNPKGIVLELNPAFTKVTGFDEHEVVGESISTFVKKEEGERIIKKAVDEDSVKEEEIVITTKDGKEVPVTVFAKSRKIKDEGVNGVFLSFFDLTEIKKKEKEAKKRKEELEEKVEEMEKINRLTIGREAKMAELKEKIKELEEKLAKYKKEETNE